MSAENVIRKGEILQACSAFKVVIALQCCLCVRVCARSEEEGKIISIFLNYMETFFR